MGQKMAFLSRIIKKSCFLVFKEVSEIEKSQAFENQL